MKLQILLSLFCIVGIMNETLSMKKRGRGEEPENKEEVRHTNRKLHTFGEAVDAIAKNTNLEILTLVDPQMCNGNGDTLLHMAILLGNVPAITTLLQRDSTLVTRANLTGSTPLAIATMMGYTAIANTLRQAGATA